MKSNKDDILIIRCDRDFKLLLKKIALNKGATMSKVVMDAVNKCHKDKGRQIRTRIVNLNK